MATPEDIADALGSFYEQKIGPQSDRIGEQFDRIRDQMARMGQDLRGEIAGSEARLRAELDEFRRDVDAHFDALYQRLDKRPVEPH